MKINKQNLTKTVQIIITLVYVIGFHSPLALAEAATGLPPVTSNDIFSLQNNTPLYDPTADCSDSSSTTPTTSTPTISTPGITVDNTDAMQAAKQASTAGAQVGYALYNASGQELANYNDKFENYGASITKSMLLVAYLQQVGTGTLSDDAKTNLTSMIEDSADGSASDPGPAYWVYSHLNNPEKDVESVASAAGMTGFKFNDKDPLYVLGQSQITANDFAQFFSKIDTYIPSSQQNFGLGILANLDPSDQTGLLTAGLPGTVYSKEGWKPEPDSVNPFGAEGQPYIVNQAAQFSVSSNNYGVAFTVSGVSDRASGEAIIKNVASQLIQTSSNQTPASPSCCSTSSTPVSGTTGPITPVSTTGYEKQNAETVIGIAKTEDLGQFGALIGLMTGLDESTLTNDANSNVPLSEQNPNKQGDGSSGESLGIFQQQIDDNWSTISSDPNNTAAINQLMTPAYAAEAFYGSPSGSTGISSALTKGLQDVSGWQNMQPQVAAQMVQNPGNPPNAEDINYQNEVLSHKADAESLLNQLWNSSPAVALPVPFSGGVSAGGGTVTSSSGSNCSTSGSTAPSNGSVAQEAEALAWPTPFTSPASNRPSALTPSPAYLTALKQYNPAGLGIFDGADCGVFVATVLRASGVDPNYPASFTPTQMTYVLANPSMFQVVAYQVTNTSVLQPGDILIINAGTQYAPDGKITTVGGAGGGSGHTLIWLGNYDGQSNMVAEASEDDHSGQIENYGDEITHDPLGRGYFLAVRAVQ